jgi:hypothetical protein
MFIEASTNIRNKKYGLHGQSLKGGDNLGAFWGLDDQIETPLRMVLGIHCITKYFKPVKNV